MTASALNFIAADKSVASIADASQTGLNITGDITVVAFVKLSALTAGLICGKYTRTGNQRQWALLFNVAGDNKFSFAVSADGTSPVPVYANTFGAATTNVLYCVVGRYRDRKSVV
jgi:hypothetical protein